MLVCASSKFSVLDRGQKLLQKLKKFSVGLHASNLWWSILWTHERTIFWLMSALSLGYIPDILVALTYFWRCFSYPLMKQSEGCIFPEVLSFCTCITLALYSLRFFPALGFCFSVLAYISLSAECRTKQIYGLNMFFPVWTLILSEYNSRFYVVLLQWLSISLKIKSRYITLEFLVKMAV